MAWWGTEEDGGERELFGEWRVVASGGVRCNLGIESTPDQLAGLERVGQDSGNYKKEGN